jgi:serine/threonine-protein kinase
MIPQRRTIPSHVEAAVLHAIEKLPADRFATGAEFAAALGNPNFTGPITAARPLGLSPPKTGVANSIAKGFPWVVALLAGLWAWSQHSPSASRPVRRYAVELRGLEAISPLEQVTMALSPDGRAWRMWAGQQTESRRSGFGIATSSTRARSPRRGCDQPQLVTRWHAAGFETRDPGKLLAVPVDGGSSPVVVSDTLIATGGTAWSTDGFIYSTGGYNGTVGIVRVPATGGVPTIVTTIDTGSHAFAHLNPAVLPNNKGLVFSVWYGPTRTDTDIGVADVKTGKVKILQRGLRAVYAPTGHLLIVRADGSLIALPFDQDRLVTTGPAVPVLSGIATQGGTGADLAIGGDGTLAYYAGEPRDVRETVQPVWITRDGHATAVDSGWTFNRPFNGGISLSPDGSRLALAVAGNETADIWIKQLEHGPFSRLTFEEFLKYRPSWSPDGRSLVYISDPGNNNASILQRRADGSGAGGTAAGFRQGDRRGALGARWQDPGVPDYVANP